MSVFIYENEKYVKNKIENRSMLLLLPMFGKTMVMLKGIINTYLCYKEFNPNKSIFVYYKQHDSYRESFVYIYNHANIVSRTKLSEEEWLFELSIPEKWIKDYELFLEGKYSEFSKEYKELLTVNLSSTPKKHGIIIINPSDSHKQKLKAYLETEEEVKEIFSVPNMDFETFYNDEGRD